MPDKTLIEAEVECLKLKAAINENHRLAQKSMGDALDRTILVGELLGRWKELLPHGKFEPFTETHFDGSLRTAQLYMKVSKGLSSLPKAQRIALLGTENSLTGLISRLKKDDSSGTGNGRKPAAILGPSAPVPSEQISEKGRPGGGCSSSNSPPVSSAPEPGEAADSSGEDERTDSTGSEPQETDPRPPRSGTDKPGTERATEGNDIPEENAILQRARSKPGKVDYGKCPNCAGTKWAEDEFGVACAKCHHPHGEPVGDKTEGEDPAGIRRSKCVKTAEALMRCFDDLNHLCPKAGSHKQAIELCKSLLKSAKGWK